MSSNPGLSLQNILQCKMRIRHSEIAHFPSLQQIGPNNKCKVERPMVEEGRLRFYITGIIIKLRVITR